MSEYTPTTDDVRECWSEAYQVGDREGAFDRWLAAHDREVAAKALRDAAKSALSDWAEGLARRRLWHVWLAERATALVSEPSTPAPVEPERPTCTDFHWMGQAFSSCDMCGKPFWDHVTHRGEPISDEFRAGVKRKWEVVEPDPESTADTKGTP